MGGYAALAFALRHPARLAALVLADTRAAADTPETRAARDGAIARIRATGSGPYLDGSLARLLSPTAPAGAGRPSCARGPRRARPASSRGSRRCAIAPTAPPSSAAIRCPTLAIRGADDQVTPADDMQRDGRRDRRRDVRRRIPGAGHLSHLEAPDAFERALTPFLASTALEGRLRR